MNNFFQINNNHNVYILGAGFSRDYGVPTVTDFFSKMREAFDYYLEMGFKHESNAIEKVLYFRLNASSAGYNIRLDLNNIEDLFSLATFVAPDLLEEIKVAISATIKYCMIINKTNRKRSIMVNKTNLNHDFFLDKKLKSENGSELIYEIDEYDFYTLIMASKMSDTINPLNSVITFNYDTILEKYFKFNKIKYNYHLDDATGGLSLFKLHGSTNWNSSKPITEVDLDNDFEININYNPYLVPPVWNKNFSDDIFIVWQKAIKCLETATRIIIIGFSIPETDLHFKYLLASGLKNNISLDRIIFVNPNESARKRAEFIFSSNTVNTGILRTVNMKTDDFFIKSTQIDDIGNECFINRKLYPFINRMF